AIKVRDLELADLQALLKDPELEKELKQALQDMGMPAALSSLSDFTQVVGEVNSARGRITALFVGLFKGPDRWLVAPVTALVLAVPVLGAVLYHYLAAAFVVIGTIAAEFAAFVGAAAVLLRKALAFVQQHVATIEKAKRKVDQVLADKRAALTPRETELQ